MTKTAGEIIILDTLVSRFEWRIPCVKSILQQEDDACESPHYEFCDGVWTFKITRRRHLVICHISRHVKTEVHKNYLDWKLFIVKSDGKELPLGEESYTIDEKVWKTFYIYDSIKFSWDDERGDDIKITCFLKCFECNSAFRRSPSNDDRIVFSETLSRNLKDFFLASTEGDVIIKVKEREFVAHRMVLQARSPVFFATFSVDMLEKKTGILYVKDIEPHVFQNVLLYLYTGEVTGLQSDTFCQIFAFAHKYVLEELKNECVRFIYNNLSEEILYDVLQLAHLYGEQKIKEFAEDFIAKRRKAIFPSFQWKIFTAENPALTIEILESILVAEGAMK